MKIDLAHNDDVWTLLWEVVLEKLFSKPQLTFQDGGVL